MVPQRKRERSEKNHRQETARGVAKSVEGDGQNDPPRDAIRRERLQDVSAQAPGGEEEGEIVDYQHFMYKYIITY